MAGQPCTPAEVEFRAAGEAQAMVTTGKGRARGGPFPPRSGCSRARRRGRSDRQRGLGRRVRDATRGAESATPRFRSRSSAVARRVMTATSLRFHSQGHLQTSAANVWRWGKAQSTRGAGAGPPPPRPLGGAAAEERWVAGRPARLAPLHCGYWCRDTRSATVIVEGDSPSSFYCYHSHTVRPAPSRK